MSHLTIQDINKLKEKSSKYEEIKGIVEDYFNSGCSVPHMKLEQIYSIMRGE